MHRPENRGQRKASARKPNPASENGSAAVSRETQRRKLFPQRGGEPFQVRADGRGQGFAVKPKHREPFNADQGEKNRACIKMKETKQIHAQISAQQTDRKEAQQPLQQPAAKLRELRHDQRGQKERLAQPEHARKDHHSASLSV